MMILSSRLILFVSYRNIFQDKQLLPVIKLILVFQVCQLEHFVCVQVGGWVGVCVYVCLCAYIHINQSIIYSRFETLNMCMGVLGGLVPANVKILILTYLGDTRLGKTISIIFEFETSNPFTEKQTVGSVRIVGSMFLDIDHGLPDFCPT